MPTHSKTDSKSLSLFPFGAILVVILTPHHVYARYSLAFNFEEILRPAFIFSFSVLIVYLISARIFEERSQARLVCVLFSAGVLFLGPSHLAVIFSAIIVGAVIWSREKAGDVASMLTNLVGAAVLVSTALTANRFPEAIALSVEGAESLENVSLESTPSVVHIVVDGYGSSGVLEEFYDVDNRPFIELLRDRGFIIFDPVFVPFSQTLFSLGSIMSGGYFSLPSDRSGDLRLNASKSISEGPVFQIFRSAGYSFYDNLSGYNVIGRKAAERVGIHPLTLTGLESVIFRKIPYALELAHNKLLYDNLTYFDFERLPRPFHYWQHVLAPHPPFTISSSGNVSRIDTEYLEGASHYVRDSDDRRQKYIYGYKDKLQFLNKQLPEQLDSIPIDGPIIIIIHGDHGPGAFMDFESPENSCAQERLTTFLAIYSNVPEVQNAFLAQDGRPYNLVNIYRTIFSALASSEINELQSKSRMLRWSDPSSGISLTPSQVMLNCQKRGVEDPR